LNKCLHTINRIVFVQFIVLVLSTTGYAINITNETEKKVGEKLEKPKDDTEIKNSENKKLDSIVLQKDNSPVVKPKIKSASYNTEIYMEQESLNKSGSVITFNFIQYIIQNYKFSEEMF